MSGWTGIFSNEGALKELFSESLAGFAKTSHSSECFTAPNPTTVRGETQGLAFRLNEAQSSGVDELKYRTEERALESIESASPTHLVWVFPFPPELQLTSNNKPMTPTG